MTIEDELEKEAAATDRHLAALAAISAALTGWEVESKYVAKRGSVYATLVSICDAQYITKLRIADHEETSGNHAAADLTLLVGNDGTADIDAVVAAIVAMEDGGTY
jgi:isoaspartyl peptidase/L-asparaginase-like protein (Ntn-hydrolase superfamily)